MYTIYVQFRCLDGKREAFVEAVKREGILAAVRAEDGCLRYDYYFSEADANELLLIHFKSVNVATENATGVVFF